MSIFQDDPGAKLHWLEEELREDGQPGEEVSGRSFFRTSEEREAVYIEKKRDKGVRRLKFLALLELLAILAVIWGWIQWLY